MDGPQDQKMAIRSWLPKVFRNNSSKDLTSTPDERTSLLPSGDEDDDDHATGETYNIGRDAKGEVQLVAHEFWVLFKGSVPVILAYTELAPNHLCAHCWALGCRGTCCFCFLLQ
jgi:hypothetical protein